MTDRAANIHCARVYLAQSHHFTRRHRGWSFVLLQMAANARRRATSKVAPEPVRAVQGDLFGDAA